MPTHKPTLTQLTTKLEEIAVAMGARVELVPPGESRYRLHLHMYLPSGLPLFFQSDPSGHRYDISISSVIKKADVVGWAKIADILPPDASHESLYDYFPGEIVSERITLAYTRTIKGIVVAISSRLATPEAIANYDAGVAAFIAHQQSEAAIAQQMQRMWDLCSHSKGDKFSLDRGQQQISFYNPNYTRIHQSHQGLGVELRGLSKAQLIAVLAATNRLKST